MENVIKKDVLRSSNEEANRITRECIQTALINLIAVKPFEKITITELVLRSGVSRMSFYRNYKTKEDVILDICADLKNQFAQSIADKVFEKDPLKWYCGFFSEVKTYEKEAALLFSPNMPPSISFMLLSAAGDVFINSASSKDDKYKAAAWVGALTGLVYRWLVGGMKESPSEMAELCVNMINTQ